MHNPRIGRIVGVSSCFALLLCATPALTQTTRDASRVDFSMTPVSDNTGFSFGLGLLATQYVFNGDARHVWASAGDAGVSEGISMTAGYAWRSFAVNLAFEVTSFGPALGDGGALALIPSVAVPLSRFQDGRAQVGVELAYVRQGVGGISFPPGMFPLERTSVGGDHTYASGGNVAVLGNGARVMLAATYRTSNHLTWVGSAGVTAMSYDQAELDGYYYGLLDSAVSLSPLFAVAFRWEP